MYRCINNSCSHTIKNINQHKPTADEVIFLINSWRWCFNVHDDATLYECLLWGSWHHSSAEAAVIVEWPRNTCEVFIQDVLYVGSWFILVVVWTDSSKPLAHNFPEPRREDQSPRLCPSTSHQIDV